MSKIVVFISKAGVSKLDWSQIYFFFLFGHCFLEKLKRMLKIRQVLR